jgi:hypothetical protein
MGATFLSTAAHSGGGKKGYIAEVTLPVKVDANTTLHAYLIQVMLPKGDGGAPVSIGAQDDAAGHALARQIASSIRLAH